MAVLIDSYSESNATTEQVIANISPLYYTAKGQSFTGQSAILDSVVFFTKKVGTPTGSAYAKIYAHTGVYGTSSRGTGGPLATSDPIDVSTTSTTSSLVTWNFSSTNRIKLEDTYYVVVIVYEGGDSSNYISLYSDNSAPTHSGNLVSITDGDWGGGTVDMCFYIYGEPITTPTVGVKYPLPAFKKP